MSTVVNARDVLLAAASPRLLAPANAAIIIDSTTPIFQISSVGVATPTSITFTARLIGGIEGVVTFSASGGTLTSISGNTCVLLASNMPGSSCTVTASLTYRGTVFSTSSVIGKVVDGAAGSGTTTYTWIKYGTSAAGAGLTDDPTGMTYIGLAQNKTTATESTIASDYTWSLFQGGQGLPGNNGADGVTTYTWLKYSDFADGTSLYDVPNSGTLYIGLAVNKTTATESTLKTDYVWSKFRGDNGVPGDNGVRGAGHYYAVGSVWSDTVADAATPGANVLDDVVTISNGTTFVSEKKWTGSAWVDNGVVIDGNLIVNGSVTAVKVNTNGLVVRDAAGNAIVGIGVPLAVGYEAPGTKNVDLVPSINSAATTSTWVGTTGVGKPADNATVGADASNLKVGVGQRNLLSNSLPVSLTGYTAYTTATGTLEGGGPVLGQASTGTDIYGRNRRTNVYVHSVGTPPSGGLMDIYQNINTRALVTAGQRYEFGVDIAAYRCAGRLVVFWYDSGGVLLLTEFGGVVSEGATYTSGDAFPRSTFLGVAPVGAVTALTAARGTFDGRADPYVFASEWYTGAALASQTTPSLWSEMPAAAATNTAAAQSAADSANAAINHVTTGLATKLNAAAASTLTGTVTISTSGSILAGTTTNGSYHSPTGFFGVQGGVVKFSVPTSGDPTFAGLLSAAYGSFGALEFASTGYLRSGMTAYLTGTGTWQGMVGGVFKASWGNSAGAYMAWDGSSLTVNGAILAGGTVSGATISSSTINNATISNPTLDAFSVSGTFGTGSSGANGHTLAQSMSGAGSGGAGGFQYTWVAEKTSVGTGTARLSNTSGSTATVFCTGPSNSTQTVEVTLTCRDANGRISYAYGSLTFQFGTPL